MMSGSTMVGIISAQNNIQLAVQNNRIANSTVNQGRIRERQGIFSGNMQAVEEGQELQAKGEEIKAGTFEHLGNAINDLNISADNNDNYETDEESADDSGGMPEGATRTAGDTTGGNVDIAV